MTSYSSLLNSEQGEGREHDDDIDDEYGASNWGTVISEVESTAGKECNCIVFFLFFVKGNSFFVDVLLLLWERLADDFDVVFVVDCDGAGDKVLVADNAGLETAWALLDALDVFVESMWELVDIVSMNKEPNRIEDDDRLPLPLVLVYAKDNGGGIREEADTTLLLLL